MADHMEYMSKSPILYHCNLSCLGLYWLRAVIRDRLAHRLPLQPQPLSAAKSAEDLLVSRMLTVLATMPRRKYPAEDWPADWPSVSSMYTRSKKAREHHSQPGALYSSPSTFMTGRSASCCLPFVGTVPNNTDKTPDHWRITERSRRNPVTIHGHCAVLTVRLLWTCFLLCSIAFLSR